MATMHLKTNYTRNKNTLESIKRFDAFSLYVNAVLIGFWVFFKWFVSYLWFIVHSNSRGSRDSEKNESPVHHNSNHDQPPAFVVDNYFGRHSYIKVKGVKFHYVECGNSSDPAILLLHGFPDCWFGWRHQIKELSRFFRVIALDLKGFNDSDKPSWRRDYKPNRICKELAAFIRALNLNSVSIIGHDLGALIGYLLIHTNPDLINRFICVSAPHPNLFWNNINTHSKKSAINLTWLRLIQLPYIPEMEHTRPDSNFLERSLSHMNRGFSEKSNIKTDVKCDEFYETIMDAYRYVFSRLRSDWSGPFNYYRNLPFYRVREGSTISCPCLIITGNEDPQYRLESLISSTEYCDSFVVKIIEGAGHYPHQEMSDEFNQIILKFLVGQRATTANHEKQSNNPCTNRNGQAKANDNLIGKIFGIVSNGVFRVHGKTSEMLHHMSIN